MWDGSKQAIEHAFKCGLKIKEMTGISVKVAILPRDKDPNEVEPNVIIESIVDALTVSKMAYIKYMAKLRA